MISNSHTYMRPYLGTYMLCCRFWHTVSSSVSEHPHSLIRVFAVRMKKAWVLSYPLNAQRRLWSDWADAQADLSLRWAHSRFVGFDMRRLIYDSTSFLKFLWGFLFYYYYFILFWHMSSLVTKPTKWRCAQRRLRSAWASAQSDQSLCYALNG